MSAGELDPERRRALRHYVEVVMSMRQQNTAEYMEYAAEQTNRLLEVFGMSDRVEFTRGQYRALAQAEAGSDQPQATEANRGR